MDVKDFIGLQPSHNILIQGLCTKISCMSNTIIGNKYNKYVSILFFSLPPLKNVYYTILNISNKLSNIMVQNSCVYNKKVLSSHNGV